MVKLEVASSFESPNQMFLSSLHRTILMWFWHGLITTTVNREFEEATTAAATKTSLKKNKQ